MSASNTEAPASPRPTVFLSYASEDRRAAQLIRDALPGYGMEVWYDESDLVGGDAWDQKIRRQIRECTYFMPVISAHTEARHEGYFRREWRLAVERTLDMADDHVFLLPVVIDATAEAGARVPDKFRAVQWLRLPAGQPSAALEALCRRLASGETASSDRPRTARGLEKGIEEDGSGAGRRAANRALRPRRADRSVPREFPPFPREEPGQRVRFGFEIAAWALQSARAGFSQLPKLVRIGIYCWVATVVLSRGCTHGNFGHDAPPKVSSTQAQKLQQIGASHSGNWTPVDTTQLLTQIAKEIPSAARDDSSAFGRVLAIPFTAPAGDAAAQKLAGAVFTQIYGRLAIVGHGHVALAEQPLPTLDAADARLQGRAHASQYIVWGAVAGRAPDQQLTVKIIAVADGSVSWSASYPLAGADPAGIADEVSSNVPHHKDD